MLSLPTFLSFLVYVFTCVFIIQNRLPFPPPNSTQSLRYNSPDDILFPRLGSTKVQLCDCWVSECMNAQLPLHLLKNSVPCSVFSFPLSSFFSARNGIVITANHAWIVIKYPFPDWNFFLSESFKECNFQTVISITFSRLLNQSFIGKESFKGHRN